MTKRKVVSTSSHVDPSKAGKRASAGTQRVYRGTIEAQWECSSCGTTGIPGSQKRCPTCGNPKGGDETYTAGQRGKYLSATQLTAMGVDPTQHLSDEECAYCGAKLKPGTQQCPNCNAPLGDVGYTTRICPACNRHSNEEKCPSCGTPTEAKLVAHHSSAVVQVPSPPKKETSAPVEKFKLNRNTIIAIVAVIGVLLSMCCIGALMMRPKEAVATVTATHWERAIRMQEYQYVETGDWSLPPDADLVRTSEEIHHYDQIYTGDEEECRYEQSCESYSVYDHTETTCYDDGTCDEHDVYRTEQDCTDERVCEMVPQYQSVPVYDTYYTYNEWRWVDVDPLRTTGADRSPIWPEFTRSDTLREAPGGRIETCTVEFQTDKDAYTTEVDCADFFQFVDGSQWKITYSGNKITNIEPAP